MRAIGSRVAHGTAHDLKNPRKYSNTRNGTIVQYNYHQPFDEEVVNQDRPYVVKWDNEDGFFGYSDEEVVDVDAPLYKTTNERKQ